MTTQSFSTRVRHDSDATFLEWGEEFSDALAAIGLVQTADSGQINWATATRAGANASAGYEIWRFDDSMQGTAPIVLKVDYRTGSLTTAPIIQITVGTGSNGSGTITGTALTTAVAMNTNNTQVTDTARQSYFCCVEGFLGIAWKVGASGSEGGFFICRSCDSDGVPTADGALVHWSAASPTAVGGRQALRFAATAQAYTLSSNISNSALGINPQANTTSVVDGDLQFFLGWTITPRVVPLFAVVGVLPGELAVGGTFSITVVGTTARTFIRLPVEFGPFGSIGASVSGGMAHAMIWE